MSRFSRIFYRKSLIYMKFSQELKKEACSW